VQRSCPSEHGVRQKAFFDSSRRLSENTARDRGKRVFSRIPFWINPQQPEPQPRRRNRIRTTPTLPTHPPPPRRLRAPWRQRFSVAAGNATTVRLPAFVRRALVQGLFGQAHRWRYASMASAYADAKKTHSPYRKALRADCTCNGRDPAGLESVRSEHRPNAYPASAVDTTTGLASVFRRPDGRDLTAEFTPVLLQGLNAETRARARRRMKVADGQSRM